MRLAPSLAIAAASCLIGAAAAPGQGDCLGDAVLNPGGLPGEEFAASVALDGDSVGAVLAVARARRTSTMTARSTRRTYSLSSTPGPAVTAARTSRSTDRSTPATCSLSSTRSPQVVTAGTCMAFGWPSPAARSRIIRLPSRGPARDR